MSRLRGLTRRLLPASFRGGLLRRLRRRPAVGSVDLGDLRQLAPISAEWGFDRGRPVDRYYIDRFLAQRAGDIRGRVLEVGSDRYTRTFGRDQVTRSDVLHVVESRPGVTIVDDLTQGDAIPGGAFDCVIVTQTLQCIFDVRAAIGTLHRVLRPGGVALVTVPGISKVSRDDMDQWGYHWSFTTDSMRRLFGEIFGLSNVVVESHGNVLAAIAFLHGLAAHELEPRELDHHDPDFQVLITVRARKPEAP